MPLSGNETAVKSLGGQSCLNVAGVPMKKRRLIWPSSPTPEEQSLLHAETDSLEKDHRSPSQETELPNSSVTASASGLSHSIKSLVPEGNKRSCDDIVPTDRINHSTFGIEEPSLALSDSLPKLDDDEKLVAAEKSANILVKSANILVKSTKAELNLACSKPANISFCGVTQVKPLGGVPMKKRRFIIRPPSPPPENHSSMHLGNDSLQQACFSQSQEPAPSNASVAGISCRLSDDENNSFLPENKRIIPDNILQTRNIEHSRVKIEQPCHTIASDSMSKLDNQEKLMAAEKSSNSLIKSSETALNLAPNKAPACSADKETLNQQVAEAKCKEISTVSGSSKLSLGLKDGHISALEDQSKVGNSWNHGNAEPVSLNLSLSNGERSTQCKMDDVQSHTDTADICADRSNWDLNTTMDTWEASVNDKTAGQVTADGSKIAGVTHDIKPLMSTELGGASITTEKQILENRECRSSFSRVCSRSSHELNSEDSLHLRLSASFLPFNSQERSSSSANNDSHSVIRNISIARGQSSGGNTVNSRTIKSEPFDETLKHDSSKTKANPMVTLDIRAVSVKHELVEKNAQEVSKSSNLSSGKAVDSNSLKDEPFHEVNSETCKLVDGTSHQSDKQVLQCEDTSVLQCEDTSGQPTCLTNEHVLQGQDIRGQPSCSTNKQVFQDQETGGQPTCSMDEQGLQGHNTLTEPTCLIGFPVNCSEASKELCETTEQVASETGSMPMSHSGKVIDGSGVIDAAIAADNSVGHRLNVTDEVPPDPHQNGEGTVSDDERINLSGDMLEEDSYCSEYESDGNSVPMDIEEDGRGQYDYEDGEVREPEVHSSVENPVCEKRKDINNGDSDVRNTDSADVQDDAHLTSFHVKGMDTKSEEPVEKNKGTVEESTNTDLDMKPIDDASRDASQEESCAAEVLTSGADKRKTIQRKPLDLSANKGVLKDVETEQSSDQAPSGGQGTLAFVAQGIDENVKTSKVEKNETALPKVETAIDSDDAAKDANSGGNPSRIINLSVASNMSSFCKTRSLSGKLLSSRPGRERLPDMPLEGEKLHPRGRDENYEGSHKFSRERYHDQSSRNSRWNFIHGSHGRGRLASRIDSSRNERGSERDCMSRHKYASGVTGSDGEFLDYNIGPDGTFIGTARGGRKLLDDDPPFFRHLPSRGRSPVGRDGPASRGMQMVRRLPRSIGEDSSEVVGLRHAEKIMRGFPDDSQEHTYTRPQPPYEGLDGHFIQGTRNFSSVQRRDLPQMRSKSPIRSHSPGPWSSSRRRSPDGFGGHPELPHRRSPLYRMERMRSPNDPGFPAERVARRHGSPSYLSRPSDLRDMDPGRDHGHPRSMIPNRSPTARVLLRSRRFNIVEPRERTENDEFFEGPMRSGRFHELGGDGNGDERRRFGERRTFRPPFNGSDGENFHVNTEDGPRSFRFFAGDDFHERANMREREFDRRIKNRPGNGPRRPRSIEEQEGNYRHGGQVLYEDSFDDMSRMKRKRF